MTVQISKAFKQVKECNKRFVVLYGGGGSGKSHFISQHIILDLLNTKNIKWCVIRKVAKTNKISTYDELTKRIDEYGLNSSFKINQTDLSITCKATKSKVIFLGCDDSEKLKSLSGITKFWLEEASELTINDFFQIDLRLRGKSEVLKQIFISFNPVHVNHWLKVYFFDTIQPDAYVLKTTYLDNPFIDEKYKARLEGYKETSPFHYDVYCLGNWGNLEGLIYTNNWTVTNVLPPTYDEIIYGLDFGFNNPSALVKVLIYDSEYYIDEVLYQSNLTNSDLIQHLKPLEVKHIIYCDSAEPDKIKELQNAGFNATDSDKSVSDGIDFVKSKKLHITESSINLINELNTYSWKKNKNNQATDEPIKIADHLLDALRYAIYTHNKSKVSVPRIGVNGITYTKEHTPTSSASAINNLKQRFRHRI